MLSLCKKQKKLTKCEHVSSPRPLWPVSKGAGLYHYHIVQSKACKRDSSAAVHWRTSILLCPLLVVSRAKVDTGRINGAARQVGEVYRHHWVLCLPSLKSGRHKRLCQFFSVLTSHDRFSAKKVSFGIQNCQIVFFFWVKLLGMYTNKCRAVENARQISNDHIEGLGSGIECWRHFRCSEALLPEMSFRH